VSLPNDSATSPSPHSAVKRNSSPTYDPISARECHRISVIYAVDAPTDLVKPLAAAYGEPIWQRLRFARLEPAYRAGLKQFPRALGCWELDEVSFQHAECPVSAARMWLFALPNDLLVLALTVETTGDAPTVISLLEDLHHRRVRIADHGVWDELIRRAPDTLGDLLAQSSLSLETYNLLHLADTFSNEVQESAVSVQLVSSLIYRFEEPYERLSPRIRLPAETNRGAAFAATGPYVGVTAKNQGYVENAIFTSCLLFVGALMTLRTIRNDSFTELKRARTHLAPVEDISPRASRAQRAVLAATSQRMARMQLDLSCGVEAFERIASTVPSLRVTDFHEALFESARINDETDAVSRILGRITAALTAEAGRRHAAERQHDERRSLIRAVSLGVITTVALPLGVVFGFFGMSAREISAARSFLDVNFYRVFYVALGGMLGVAVLLAGVLYLKFTLDGRRERRRLKEALEVD
jgi:hypothetical protein